VFPIFFDLDWVGLNPPHLSFPNTSDYRQWPLVPGAVWHFLHLCCVLWSKTLFYTLFSPSYLSSSFPQIVPTTFMSFKILFIMSHKNSSYIELFTHVFI
jgi:hypothetical protein